MSSSLIIAILLVSFVAVHLAVMGQSNEALMDSSSLVSSLSIKDKIVETICEHRYRCFGKLNTKEFCIKLENNISDMPFEIR